MLRVVRGTRIVRQIKRPQAEGLGEPTAEPHGPADSEDTAPHAPWSFRAECLREGL